MIAKKETSIQFNYASALHIVQNLVVRSIKNRKKSIVVFYKY